MLAVLLLLLRADDVVLEITRAVGLGPEPDLPGNRRTQHGVVGWKQIGIRWRAVPPRPGFAPERVFECEAAVDPRLEVRPVDRHLQLVPGTAIEHPLPFAPAFDGATDAIVELPERDVVLSVVVADRQPVTIRLHVEENAGTPVGLARHGLEFHGDG